MLIKRHRRLPSVRQVAPPALVLGLAGAIILGSLRRNSALVLAPTVTYVGAVLGACARVERPADVPAWRVATAVITIHLSYGAGMLAGVLR